MLEINNTIINEPILNILYELRKLLIKQNINLLKDIELKGNNALVTCLCHKDGKENHPSCNILLEDYNNVNIGTVHCFTCGYKDSFVNFIAKCLNKPILDIEDWLVNNFDHTNIIDIKRDIKKITYEPNKLCKPITNYITEEQLNKYRYYHPYMYKRKLTNAVINKYDIGYDFDSNSITFPVYTADNKCLYVVKRRVDRKEFFIPKGVDKTIFGLNHITKPDVIICESVFNALTCAVYGYDALALFGTGSKEQYDILNKLPVRHYILMFDGDKAGRLGALKFKQHVKNKLITDIIIPFGKDVNDLDKENFEKLLNTKN